MRSIVISVSVCLCTRISNKKDTSKVYQIFVTYMLGSVLTDAVDDDGVRPRQ